MFDNTFSIQYANIQIFCLLICYYKKVHLTQNELIKEFSYFDISSRTVNLQKGEMITELKGKIKKKIVKILRKHYPWL